MQTRRWDARRKRVEKALAIVKAILTMGYCKVFHVLRTGTGQSGWAIQRAAEHAGLSFPPSASCDMSFGEMVIGVLPVVLSEPSEYQDIRV